MSRTAPAPTARQTRDPAESARVAGAAVERFVREHPGPAAEVVVVIPALDEEEAVAGVVRSVPSTICGLSVETLVMDDGSSDATRARAEAVGALVCTFDVNLGQGTAFKVGYRLARERGARIIATADADGQFDPQELPSLVGPILAGQADFVNGSRRLGTTYTTDPVRRVGVVVFAALLSALTGCRVTDPANGLRAMRAEVSAELDLRQTQYQTSEVLINVIAHGFRLREVPATMYQRTAGETKKGHNLIYGARFARVLVMTWWRMRSVAKVNLPPRQGLW